MTAEQPTGASRSWYADDDFVMIRGEAVRALGDYHSAGVFQRITWRCERTGQWRATIAEIADEVWLTVDQTRKAIKRLREVGAVTGDKTHPMDNTLTWRVVWEADPAERATAHMERAQARMHAGSGPDTPIETETTTRDKNCNGSAVAALEALLDRLMLSDFDASSVWDTIKAERPDIARPTEFIEHLDSQYGEHAARGFLEGLGVA